MAAIAVAESSTTTATAHARAHGLLNTATGIAQIIAKKGFKNIDVARVAVRDKTKKRDWMKVR